MQSSYSLSQSIRSRFPARGDTLQVFGVVLFVVFGWSVRGFLYKIPAFTLYFGLPVNLAILCYMFAFALLESLLVMGFLLVLAAALPGHLLKQGFAYKGLLIVLVATIGMIVFESYFKVEFFKDIMAGDRSSIPPFLIGCLVSVAILAGLLYAFARWPRLQAAARAALEHLSIFTYIYVPLGLIGLIVVIVRNLP